MFLSLSEYFSFSRILCQDAGWGSNPPSNFKSCLDDLQWTHNGDTDEGGISKYLKLPPSCFDFGSHLSRICRLFVTPFMNYRETKFENIPHLTSKMLRWYNMHDNLWQGKTWIRKKGNFRGNLLVKNLNANFRPQRTVSFTKFKFDQNISESGKNGFPLKLGLWRPEREGGLGPFCVQWEWWWQNYNWRPTLERTNLHPLSDRNPSLMQAARLSVSDDHLFWDLLHIKYFHRDENLQTK